MAGIWHEDADKFLWHSTDEETYRAGVEREVNEEIKIDTPFEDRIVALLNDDTTEVGRVHLGIVHVFKLTEAEGGKTRSDDHRTDISRKERIVCAPRNHGDVVADLSRFARPFTAVTPAAGKQATKLLFSRQAEQAKFQLQVTFQLQATFQLLAKFQLQVNLPQAQKQVEVQARVRVQVRAAAAE